MLGGYTFLLRLCRLATLRRCRLRRNVGGGLNLFPCILGLRGSFPDSWERGGGCCGSCVSVSIAVYIKLNKLQALGNFTGLQFRTDGNTLLAERVVDRFVKFNK